MLLPVWHGVTQVEVTRYSPTLGDAIAPNTLDSFDKIAMNVVNVVRPDLHQAIMRKIVYTEHWASAETKQVTVGDVQDGPIRHAVLPNKLVNRIEILACVLQEQFPQSTEKWMEGFQRDAHPTREVEIWEDIATRYKRAISKGEVTVEQRESVFKALLTASLGNHTEADKFIVDAFGDKSEIILNSMRRDKNVFAQQSSQDIELMSQIDLDIENLIGPESEIDLDYINEIVAQTIIDQG